MTEFKGFIFPRPTASGPPIDVNAIRLKPGAKLLDEDRNEIGTIESIEVTEKGVMAHGFIDHALARRFGLTSMRDVSLGSETTGDQ